MTERHDTIEESRFFIASGHGWVPRFWDVVEMLKVLEVSGENDLGSSQRLKSLLMQIVRLSTLSHPNKWTVIGLIVHLPMKAHGKVCFQSWESAFTDQLSGRERGLQKQKFLFLWLFQLRKIKTKEVHPASTFKDVRTPNSSYGDKSDLPKNLEKSLRLRLALPSCFSSTCELFLLCTFYCHREDERGKKVMKTFGHALFVCVAPVFVHVVEGGREGDRGGERMRRRKRWDLWSHLFTRGLSPERPFTVVNHLHGDILKLRWMGSSDAFQTCLWYTLWEIVDGSHSPCAGWDYTPEAKEHLGLLFKCCSATIY